MGRYKVPLIKVFDWHLDNYSRESQINRSRHQELHWWICRGKYSVTGAFKKQRNKFLVNRFGWDYLWKQSRSKVLRPWKLLISSQPACGRPLKKRKGLFGQLCSRRRQKWHPCRPWKRPVPQSWRWREKQNLQSRPVLKVRWLQQTQKHRWISGKVVRLQRR